MKERERAGKGEIERAGKRESHPVGPTHESEGMDRVISLPVVWAMLPRLPGIARDMLLHLVRLSESSRHLDLRSVLVVAVLRQLLTPSCPRSISATQRMMLRARQLPVRGRVWIATAVVPPPPEPDLCDSLMDAVAALAADLPSQLAAAAASCRAPGLVPVEAEWTAHRASAVSDRELLPELEAGELYRAMMASGDCSSPTTILYLHGGAYYLLDPATHRTTTAELARLTGGRCYSVRYRLAPQNPFPAALLDALTSYMALLYPPPGAFHEPVEAAHIVFAGDSAGGGLCFALLQVVRYLRCQDLHVRWFGRHREVPLPAAVAVSSPWVDLTQSLPSWRSNARFDYLPSRPQPPPPACAAWPVTPPRRSLYVDDGLVAHPLVTPSVCPSWAGSPPIYLCSGSELLADEHRSLATTLAVRDGVPVLYEHYASMPHCFALVLSAAVARRCLGSWAAFMHMAVHNPSALLHDLPAAVAVDGDSVQTLDLEKLAADLPPYADMVQRVRAAALATMGDKT